MELSGKPAGKGQTADLVLVQEPGAAGRCSLHASALALLLLFLVLPLCLCSSWVCATCRSCCFWGDVAPPVMEWRFALNHILPLGESTGGPTPSHRCSSSTSSPAPAAAAQPPSALTAKTEAKPKDRIGVERCRRLRGSGRRGKARGKVGGKVWCQKQIPAPCQRGRFPVFILSL